ncbi:MAG: hypothetical protein V4636_14510 [Pseudomonadota bacterium]
MQPHRISNHWLHLDAEDGPFIADMVCHAFRISLFHLAQASLLHYFSAVSDAAGLARRLPSMSIGATMVQIGAKISATDSSTVMIKKTALMK